MKTDVFTATRFVEDRKAADMPVATEKQLAKAAQLIAQNPLLRQHNSPLGLQQLALQLPMTRYDRRVAKIELKPRLTRGVNLKVKADQASVEAFVEANPGITAHEAAQTISGMSGYDHPGVPVRRVSRFLQENPTRRMPSHIREKALMLSAIAEAIGVIASQPSATPEEVTA